MTGRRADDDLAHMVATVWEEVLDRTVDPDDDFLALGGNSLHAVRIVSRLEESLDIHLSVRAVLEGRTVRLMTDRVRGALAEQGEMSPSVGEGS
jgi:acyl carrier protein